MQIWKAGAIVWLLVMSGAAGASSLADSLTTLFQCGFYGVDAAADFERAGIPLDGKVTALSEPILLQHGSSIAKVSVLMTDTEEVYKAYGDFPDPARPKSISWTWLMVDPRPVKGEAIPLSGADEHGAYRGCALAYSSGE